MQLPQWEGRNIKIINRNRREDTCSVAYCFLHFNLIKNVVFHYCIEVNSTFLPEKRKCNPLEQAQIGAPHILSWQIHLEFKCFKKQSLSTSIP
jgi:hypothetical protein